jgi:hypothetical protein
MQKWTAPFMDTVTTAGYQPAVSVTATLRLPGYCTRRALWLKRSASEGAAPTSAGSSFGQVRDQYLAEVDLTAFGLQSDGP